MGHWGIKSYECDEAADALDDGFERVHGPCYEELMHDSNPLSYEQVQQRLAGPETLTAALDALSANAGHEIEAWDEIDRLAFVGVVVRHAELGVPIGDDWRRLAIDWLEHEEIEWEEDEARKRRRLEEIALLKSAR